MALQVLHVKGLSNLHKSAQKDPSAKDAFYTVINGLIVRTSEGQPFNQRLLREHDDAITALTVSASGSLIASGQKGKNSDVVIWDATSGKAKFRFQEHDVEVVSLCFSSDEKLLLTVGNQRDRKLFIVDTSTGKIVAKAAIEAQRITASATATYHDNRIYTFATAAENDVTIWTVDPFRATFTPKRVTAGSVRRTFSSLLFSHDGKWLFCGTASSDIVTVNVASAAMQMSHTVCVGGGVGDMLLSSAGRIIVGGGDGGLYDFVPNDDMWRMVEPFAKVPGTITSLSLDHDHTLIVGTAQGGLFRVPTSGGACLTLELSHPGILRGVVFRKGSGSLVGTCGDDGGVCLWDAENFGLICRASEGPSVGPALSLALTSSAIVAGWADGTIRCHQPQAGTPGAAGKSLWVLPGAHSFAHSKGTTALSISHSEQFIVSGGDGGELRVWDFASREMVSHMKLHAQPITDIHIMKDDGHFVASCADRSWSVWDINRESPNVIFRAGSLLKGCAVMPDQVTVITCSLDHRVLMWDMRAPDPVKSINNAHGGEAAAVAASTSGNYFATGGGDCLVKMWDLRLWAQIGEGAVHTAPITKIAFQPEGSKLVSVGMDGAIVTWKVNV